MVPTIKMPLSRLDTHTVLLICSFLILLFVLQTGRIAFRNGLRKAPGPLLARFTNLWRVSLVWSGNAHEEYRKLHMRYGRIVRTAPNVVDISDPSVIPIVYGISSKYLKSNFYTTLATAYEGEIMDSLFSTRDPEHHKALKRPVAQKFSMSSIRTLESLVDPCSQTFCDAMAELAGTPVDLGTWLQWYAFDAIGEITFNQRFGFMNGRRDVENMIAGLEFGLRYAGIVGQMPFLHRFLLGNLTLAKIRNWLAPNAPDPIGTATKMVLKCLREYDERDLNKSDECDKRTDFLAYLRGQGKGQGSQIGTRDMMNHLMNNLLAGSDTTAISLRAVFYYVMRDRRIYEKLQREIDDAEKAGKLSRFVTFAESLELPYLQLCIKEAMRMHPGVAYPLERIVPEGGVELCDIFLPHGTIVGVNAAVIHRDKNIFGSDADEFRPERWIQSESDRDVQNMDRHILTFGSGARTCIGKNISMMEMGKFIPQILRQFDLQWASDKPTWDVKTWWFAKQSGMFVTFSPRSKASANAF